MMSDNKKHRPSRDPAHKIEEGDPALCAAKLVESTQRLGQLLTNTSDLSRPTEKRKRHHSPRQRHQHRHVMPKRANGYYPKKLVNLDGEPVVTGKGATPQSYRHGGPEILEENQVSPPPRDVASDESHASVEGKETDKTLRPEFCEDDRTLTAPRVLAFYEIDKATTQQRGNISNDYMAETLPYDEAIRVSQVESTGTMLGESEVESHSIHTLEVSRESQRETLPGAIREGGNTEEEDDTRFSVDPEVAPSNELTHDDMYMISAHAVEEPILVPAVRRRPRYRLVLLGVLAAVVGLVIGLVIPFGGGNGKDSGDPTGSSLPGVWTQLGDDTVGDTASDGFGSSMSLSLNGSIVAIGALWSDENGVNSGSVCVFELERGNWTQVGQSIAGLPGDNCGNSVALSGDGDVLAVGCYYHNGPAGIKSGQVRMFEKLGSGWVQIGSDIDGQEAKREFGFKVSVSLDGRVVGVGGIAHAQVFE